MQTPQLKKTDSSITSFPISKLWNYMDQLLHCDEKSV